MFWQAAPTAAHPHGYESVLVPAPAADGSAATRTTRYLLPATTVRVHARLRLQSIGLDVLDDFQGLRLPLSERLIDHGYQAAPTLRSRVPTMTVPGTERELVLGADGSSASAQPPRDDDCAVQGHVSMIAK